VSRIKRGARSGKTTVGGFRHKPVPPDIKPQHHVVPVPFGQSYSGGGYDFRFVYSFPAQYPQTAFFFAITLPVPVVNQVHVVMLFCDAESLSQFSRAVA
jgi:hypothetical protein